MSGLRGGGVLFLVLVAGLAGGCMVGTSGQGKGQAQGEGPGHRAQALALTPDQELKLGRQAYQEVLKKSRRLPDDDPSVRVVREVGKNIAKASEIKPLQREINLHLEGYEFEWEFNVLQSDQVNAFCLPGGKVAVFTGLIPVVREGGELNKDQLATVMSHEIAHALAHHASERVARAQKYQAALEAASGALGRMGEGEKNALIGLLGAGASINSKAYDRQQESEADHIGVFLMPFAGYDPRQTLVFWKKMARLSEQSGHVPEILSDHPSDARRIHQLEWWIPMAERADAAYRAGRYVGAPHAGASRER